MSWDIQIDTTKETVNSIAASNFKGWHVEKGVNFWPDKKIRLGEPDTLALEIFSYYAPKHPLFTKSSKIATMGSCFAMRIKEWMHKYKNSTDTIFIPEGLNNTFAVRQWIEWVLTGNRSLDAYCYDQNDKQGIHKWESKEEQTVVKEKFIQYDGFIITYGLSEIWRDKETKGVFWRGVPESLFDPNQHECVVSTLQDNIENIQQTISIIQKHCPDKPIIITLSPVPLKATFLKRPCVTSDCVSKSILRIAIDQALQNMKNVYYWPSFEYVKWLPSHTGVKTFGADENFEGSKAPDSRHVSNNTVEMIIKSFDKFFFEQELDEIIDK